ncbi:TIGR01777 family protein [Nostoc sp. FACHB-87]|uniref:thylakoid membrane protein ThyD n=1 Tax=Nostocales TaxID=1161 RepID=UPI001685972B|nr:MULTISPECIES: TIGR01777 family oxidoreductase [Nostocales]MBD2300913.1 TIGR01777 family protein [Nostoc sp. FACHB-190]MBD2455164.1 TIGR01777 family protein [Nostoc sp. FACHB-87]MBD2474242.1 TIGR01777 family protein [Anabaena sp. FACHB-83]MBD2487241.1 TIGR01777 family protein [Aulosira sp. FACHB-615]
MKVAITGATGLVGSRLVERLQTEGHQVLVLTRNAGFAQKVFPAVNFPSVEIITYTPTTSGTWQDAVSGCEAVVNLAGEPIGEGRWTAERKQEILNSRQLGTQKIVEAIAKANSKPRVLVNTSAIGFYGTSETATFDEASVSGNDFLAQVCQAWEAEATKVKDAGVRLVILRFGIVLGKGGALAKMIPPFQMFAGGPIGSGRQWFSWIHIDDVVNLILQALSKSDMEGVYNATAPNPVRMNDLAQTVGTVLNRPSWLPVPAFAIEALLGDGAIVVLEGQQVLPKRTLESGFTYQYPNLQPALKQIL